MADVYLKKVDASSRSEWASGNSYVTGDRVYLASATMQDTYWNDGTTTFSTWRTFICLIDNSSTTSPEDDSTNWIEAGTSKEYPYHCVGGDLTAGSTNSEIYLEEESTRWSTQSLGGATFYHLRRGESQFSLGKLIIVSDTPNPVFIVNKDVAVIGFSIEPDSSTERFSIVCMNGGKLGSYVSHNVHDSQYGKIDKCNIYYSGTNTYMFGIIYDNLNKIEFTDCLFSEQASEVGYADLSASGITLCLRSFIGLRRCSLFFPSVNLSNHFIWDSQAHSTGVESFVESCSFWFKSYNSTNFLYNFRSGISIKDNIFYFSESDGQEIRVVNSAHNNFECKNNVLYIGDNSATFNYTNAGEDYSEKLKNINPKFVSNDSPKGMQLRPSSPLIGGMNNSTKQLKMESEYPQGKWFDSNAAAGGDGNWDTPYNNYGEAINSFTGDEAVILIKEGQHQLQQGYWDGTSWGMANDLPKTYSGGIKFIGMGSSSVFTSDTAVTSYCAFWAQTNISNPNSRDTPFLFKDFDILLNNAGLLGRGLIGARRAEYININVNQAENLGMINSNLFDYMHQSGGNNSGEYLKMTGCTINVSQTNVSSNTNYLVGSSGGMKQFSGCTFADLNRTTSTNGGAPASFSNNNFGSYPGSYIKDCIIYSRTSNTLNFTMSSSNLEVKNCAVYSTEGPVSISSNYGGALKELDPGFIATEPHDFDLRLRPDSPLIGGLSKSLYGPDVIWVQPGSGTGTGTENDAFYWSQYSDAFLAAVQSTSKQVVFKDGTYVWTNSIIQDDNVGNNITMVAENMHQAIFTDNASRINSSGKNPTLRFKGIQMLAVDHFTWQPTCHYILDSVHVIGSKYIGAISVTASGTIFEVATGVNSYIFSNSGPVDIENCIFVDHNDRTSTQNYLTGAQSGTIKSTIFYTKNPRTYCINPSHNAVLTKCATENITNPENGVLFTENLQFVDVENKNYDLRPLSPLIGQG